MEISNFWHSFDICCKKKKKKKKKKTFQVLGLINSNYGCHISSSGYGSLQLGLQNIKDKQHFLSETEVDQKKLESVG